MNTVKKRKGGKSELQEGSKLKRQIFGVPDTPWVQETMRETRAKFKRETNHGALGRGRGCWNAAHAPTTSPWILVHRCVHPQGLLILIRPSGGNAAS